MVVRRRLTQDRRIVSHFDEALAVIDDSKRRKYTQTLELSDLGDLADLEEQPTIFTVTPLTSEGEDYAMSPTPSNLWRIFATHVRDATGFEFERKDGVIMNKHRTDFAPEVVQNVASIIITLANRGNANAFFTPPVGAVLFWEEIRKHRVSTGMADKMRQCAVLGDAPPNVRKLANDQ